jgi:hypothetical protein
VPAPALSQAHNVSETRTTAAALTAEWCWREMSIIRFSRSVGADQPRTM